MTAGPDVLVLPPRFTDDSARLARAAARAGWAVERLASWHVPPLLAEERCCLYAEPLFVMHAASALRLAVVEPTYDWLPSMPAEYVRRQVWLTMPAAARRLAGPWFVKSAGEKFFAAAVFEGGGALPADLPAALPLIVSEVVTWAAEFRYFVRDRRRVAGSPYWIEGRLPVDERGEWSADDGLSADAAAFADQLLSDDRVRLPPAVVVDVGLVAGRGWAVVEANPAWGSGLYGCDADAVLPVVRRASVAADAVTDEDRPWVIDHAAEDFR